MNRELRRLSEKEEKRQRAQRAAGRTARPKKERVGLSQFVREVRQELRRVAWPSLQELRTFTVVTVVTTLAMTGIIFGMDAAFKEGVLFVLGEVTVVDSADTAATEVLEDEEAEEVVEERPPSPYDLPGSWFVIHSYSGYENKVKANLLTRTKSMHLEESIFDVMIPMEDVVEFKSGRKVTVPKKQFPGYILVRMYLSDDTWYAVRNTPGVTGFVGSGQKPTPLSRREVERILGVAKAGEEKKTPRFKPDWEVGETVRVVEGPFADFNGVIEDINVDQSKVRVLVDIFGRETPVELSFEQIQKY